MTQIIDIEARNAPRYQAPQISFRRTDADRKPAKRFVRPNDEAPTWEEREAESARRLKAINAKRLEAQRIYVERLDVMKTYLRKCDEINAEAVRTQGLKTEFEAIKAVGNGASTFSDLSKADVCSIGNARRVIRRLEAKGLVNIDLVAAPNNIIAGKRFVFDLTPAGREFLLSGGKA